MPRIINSADMADIQDFLTSFDASFKGDLSGPCEDDCETTAPWLMGVFADEDGMPCLAPDFRRHPHDL
jgi:hypothetical protein